MAPTSAQDAQKEIGRLRTLIERTESCLEYMSPEVRTRTEKQVLPNLKKALSDLEKTAATRGGTVRSGAANAGGSNVQQPANLGQAVKKSGAANTGGFNVQSSVLESKYAPTTGPTFAETAAAHTGQKVYDVRPNKVPTPGTPIRVVNTTNVSYKDPKVLFGKWMPNKWRHILVDQFIADFLTNKFAEFTRKWPATAQNFEFAWFDDNNDYGHVDGIVVPTKYNATWAAHFLLCYDDALSKQGCTKGVDCRYRHLTLVPSEMEAIVAHDVGNGLKFLRLYAEKHRLRHYPAEALSRGIPWAPTAPTTDADKKKLEAYKTARLAKMPEGLRAGLYDFSRPVEAPTRVQPRGQPRGRGHGRNLTHRPNLLSYLIFPGIAAAAGAFRQQPPPLPPPSHVAESGDESDEAWSLTNFNR
ncbi:hypothetical protein CC80DRAFT_555665 [Byssothecium circinans]|uniref:Uncharacterized protein n=1 Tax=Byssothecium circinans TaxID=147558 RepID=A0A6A5T910_9PLEO|nr:hypothetical protein CC80DRAFT_555665 [Byssothecium circinans]